MPNIFPHQHTHWILHPPTVWVLHMSPRSRKMYHEHSPCPSLFLFIVAPDLLRKGVYLRLRNPFCLIFFSICILFYYIADTVLLTGPRMLVSILSNAFEECECARAWSYQHRACVEYEAITFISVAIFLWGHHKRLPISGEKKINVVGPSKVGERLRNDIWQLYRLVRDQSIKIGPPNPVVFASSHYLLQHHKLVPHYS